MRRSVKRTWAVARLTSMEGLRQPVFFVLFICAAALIGLSPSFAFFHLGEEGKMVSDLGLSTILTFTTLLALLTASSTITAEIDGKTALTMLAKPLRRDEFLAGKFAGVAVSASALAVLLAPVLLATLRGQEFEAVQDPWFVFAVLAGAALGVGIFGVCAAARLVFGRGPALVGAFWLAYAAAVVFLFVFTVCMSPAAAGWRWNMLAGVFFIILHTGVIAAAAAALATRCTLVQSALGTAVFFMAGHASGALVAPFRDASNRLTVMGSVLRAVLPDLDQFNLADALAAGRIDKPVSIPFDVLAGSTLYAALYGLAVLAIAGALFSKRELS